MRRIAATALLLALGCATASAGTVTPRDRFALWTLCDPVPLSAFIWDGEAGKQVDRKDGLTQEAVETAVRSRLRAADIYGTKVSLHYIDVGVQMGSSSLFQVAFRFKKYMPDPASGDEYWFPATTWISGSFGSYGTDASYILGAVAQHADKFIDEYLRVNDKRQCAASIRANAAKSRRPSKKEMGHSGLPKSR